MSDKILSQQNFFKTTLSQDITSDATTIYVNTVPEKLSGYLVISQDDAALKEIIFYDDVGINYVQCPNSGGRGIGGTVAQPHSSDETVVMDGVAEYHNAIATLLGGFRTRCELSFTPGGDNISIGAGIVVVDDSVCNNITSVTLSDIGESGSNKDGTVTSGGFRYIYAKDNEDGTFSAYVSNNAAAGGYRRLGFAKFQEGSTTIIKYIHNDDSFSQVYRGMIFDYYGGVSDIPVGYALCDGTNGTPNCLDRIVIAAGTTYTLGTNYGASTINLTHKHTNTTVSVDHAHTISHTHNYSGTTSLGDDISGADGYDRGETELADQFHKHTFSGTTSDVNGWVSSGNASISHTHGMDNQLTAAVPIIPPVIALVKIMKT